MSMAPIRGETAEFPIIVGDGEGEAAEFVVSGVFAGVKNGRTAWFKGDAVLDWVNRGVLVPLAEAAAPAPAPDAPDSPVTYSLDSAPEAPKDPERADLEARYLAAHPEGRKADGRWAIETLREKVEELEAPAVGEG